MGLQYPWPSYAKIRIDFLLRFRKKKTQPENGSSESLSLQIRANPSIPLRPSTRSIATSTRICAVMWIIARLPARHGASLSNQALLNPSTEFASCRQLRTRIRSSTPTSPQDEKLSAPQTPARLALWGYPQRPRDASSIAYSPTPTDEQPNTRRVPGPVPQRPAIRPQEASSDVAGCCEAHPTAAATGRLAREWGMRFSCSRPANLGG